MTDGTIHVAKDGTLQTGLNSDKLHGNDATALATAAQGTKADNAIPKGLATAADQALVSTGVGAWAVKTLAHIKTWLGPGTAAYTASTAYATSAQGVLATNAMPKGLATAADQVPVSTSASTWIVKTLADFKAWLGLGSAAYTASTAYATAEHNHTGVYAPVAHSHTSFTSIELSGTTPYIDFHFGNSAADYTSRLVEAASGVLSINSLKAGIITDLGTSQGRNIYAGTTDMTAGSSALATGSLYVMHE
jgi:hypothetical protein